MPVGSQYNPLQPNDGITSVAGKRPPTNGEPKGSLAPAAPSWLSEVLAGAQPTATGEPGEYQQTVQTGQYDYTNNRPATAVNTGHYPTPAPAPEAPAPAPPPVSAPPPGGSSASSAPLQGLSTAVQQIRGPEPGWANAPASRTNALQLGTRTLPIPVTVLSDVMRRFGRTY